ncbi:MAG: TetR family transcriptional regulator [Streptosporangiales bacterium]|nr:TetR family transcriptional regulator [Streptosporangiales bacterium]
MSAIRTARERARAELTREIKEEARRALAASGAHDLSLRAVARALGMASSAVYRYFPSRDELLTALIIDAYDALGHDVETADGAAPPGDFRARWRAACGAVRDWARRTPHEYALVYGSPVPGYQAPEATIGSAARVPVVLLRIAGAAHAAGELTVPAAARPPGDRLVGQARRVAERLTDVGTLGLPYDAIVRIATVWTQLFGLIGFELFGHLANTFDPADELFAYSVEQMADAVGLP